MASVRRGVTECECGGMDLDAIEALMWRALVPDGVVLSALVLPAGGTTPLVVSSEGTVADLVAALAAREPPSAPVHVELR